MAMMEVARILKPQGIKGEVKAEPLTNVLAVFNDLKEVSIDGKNMRILSITFRQGFLYVTFEGVTTRNDAENLRNKKMFVDKEKLLASKEEEEFLIDDLIGMTLYDLNGAYVGQIVDVVNYGASDIFIIESEGRTVEAPYVGEAFIRQGGRLVVDREKFDEVAI